MYRFGAARFPMFVSVRSSAKEVRTRNADFLWTLLVVLLFSLFPATSSSQEAARNVSPKAGRSTAASSDVDILSDTRGVDFGPYVKQVNFSGSFVDSIPLAAKYAPDGE